MNFAARLLSLSSSDSASLPARARCSFLVCWFVVLPVVRSVFVNVPVVCYSWAIVPASSLLPFLLLSPRLSFSLFGQFVEPEFCPLRLRFAALILWTSFGGPWTCKP